MADNYEFMIRAALGLNGVAAVNKFGYNDAITTTEETVWSSGGLYSYPAAATTMSAASTDTDDAIGGTGAKQVEVSGLDANYDEQTIIVDMDGQTPVAISPDLIRVNRVKVLGDQAQQGDIYVGAGAFASGVPANVYGKIEFEVITNANPENQTLQAVYTVPAGKKALLFTFSVSSSRSNEAVTATLKARPFGGVFQTKDKLDLFQSVFTQAYPIPIVLEPKTDIEIRGISSAVGASVSGKFSLVLIPA